MLLKSIFLTDRFFWGLGALAVLFVLGFALPLLYPVALVLTGAFAVVLGMDIWMLFGGALPVEARRRLPKVLSLGDPNPVTIQLENRSNMDLQCTVIDELPMQFQIRDFEQRLALPAGEAQEMRYELTPTERGEYSFGRINIFAATRIGLIERRVRMEAQEEAPVFPSIIQMKKFELRAFDRMAQFNGLKRLRRIGHSYEFEQIKNYVRGDDYRSINWKASSRRASLMVNQYEDERSQQVYSIIDKSRAMRMPFAGLSLMDYAVNTSLVISNIALQKHDRAGLITFSDKIGATIKADSRANQLNKILHVLYKEKERPLESNYELLFQATRKLISGRSLVLLYTNFESSYALDRVLPLLRRINNMHLLVVIFFENTEIHDFARSSADTIEDIYRQTIARQFLAEKAQMVSKLRQYGIQAVLTRPEDLSINTINKYLELKSRGLI
jgi:uncharacterized protein (DUF58 family)